MLSCSFWKSLMKSRKYLPSRDTTMDSMSGVQRLAAGIKTSGVVTQALGTTPDVPLQQMSEQEGILDNSVLRVVASRGRGPSVRLRTQTTRTMR
jgi:hypothetical protein